MTACETQLPKILLDNFIFFFMFVHTKINNKVALRGGRVPTYKIIALYLFFVA